MTPDQTFQIVASIVVGLFGAGGVAAVVGHLVTRKLGLKTNENEANKVINTTWEVIVNDLQEQIASGRTEFKDQLIALNKQIEELRAGHKDLEARLGDKDRVVLKAIAHINRQDVVIEKLGGTPLPRPEGLE